MSYQGFLVDVNKPLAIRGKALTSWKNGLLNSSKKTFHPWFTIDNVNLLSRDEFPSGLGITEEIWEECKLRVRDYMLFKNAYPLEIGTPAVQDTPPYVPVCKVCWYVHPVAKDSARHSFSFNADLWERAWRKIWWTDWTEESRMNRPAWWMYHRTNLNSLYHIIRMNGNPQQKLDALLKDTFYTAHPEFVDPREYPMLTKDYYVPPCVQPFHPWIGVDSHFRRVKEVRESEKAVAQVEIDRLKEATRLGIAELKEALAASQLLRQSESAAAHIEMEQLRETAALHPSASVSNSMAEKGTQTTAITPTLAVSSMEELWQQLNKTSPLESLPSLWADKQALGDMALWGKMVSLARSTGQDISTEQIQCCCEILTRIESGQSILCQFKSGVLHLILKFWPTWSAAVAKDSPGNAMSTAVMELALRCLRSISC